MKHILLWTISVSVGCTLISDADRFVGERDGGIDAAADSGADVPQVDSAADVGPGDAGADAQLGADVRTPEDVGPFIDGSCASQVDETREDTWEQARCCFSDDHCRGLIVGGAPDDGRCLRDSCGAIPPLASVCLPSLEATRRANGEDSCYLDLDCPAPEVCRLAADVGEFASGTCPDAPPRLPGTCMVMP